MGFAGRLSLDKLSACVALVATGAGLLLSGAQLITSIDQSRSAIAGSNKANTELRGQIVGLRAAMYAGLLSSADSGSLAQAQPALDVANAGLQAEKREDFADAALFADSAIGLYTLALRGIDPSSRAYLRVSDLRGWAIYNGDRARQTEVALANLTRATSLAHVTEVVGVVTMAAALLYAVLSLARGRNRPVERQRHVRVSIRL